MRLLVLGGTAWLGGMVVAEAVSRDHEVVCLARGESGAAPQGAQFVCGDRSDADGYADLAGEFDAVIDVARDPNHVRSALIALADRVAHWLFVSTCNVYADESTPGADESAELRAPLEDDAAWTPELYGEGKVSCERLLLDAVGPDRLLIARSGLIAGPGDLSGRTGYWPLRFSHPATDDGSVLVPDEPSLITQQLDVRDLAAWLVDCAQDQRAGIADAAGEQLPLAQYLELAREVAGHTGPVTPRSPAWLIEQGVSHWMGDRSLPLWLPLPEYAGFMARDGSHAVELGLTRRPLTETLRDVLAWELKTGPGRERGAGLSSSDERDLVRVS